MKKLIILVLFYGLSLSIVQSQNPAGCGGAKADELQKPIKLGIVIYSDDPETVWNALRIANYALSEKDSVSVFLMGKGVEIRSLSTKDFDIGNKLSDYLDSGGKIFACSTCMNSRNLKESKVCPMSTLSDLYGIIRWSDKLLTF
jgi:uncharacterized protein involved in oxidation of intracellular sulfur